jgi:hypothetical protein
MLTQMTPPPLTAPDPEQLACVSGAAQEIHPMRVVTDEAIGRQQILCRTKTGQDVSASSSLGVSRELHLTLFPQGQPRRGLASQK